MFNVWFDVLVCVMYFVCFMFVLFMLFTGDLNASDITMSDEDRIQLMIMVKEGKLSMHEAVEAVSKWHILLINIFLFVCLICPLSVISAPFKVLLVLVCHNAPVLWFIMYSIKSIALWSVDATIAILPSPQFSPVLLYFWSLTLYLVLIHLIYPSA